MDEPRSLLNDEGQMEYHIHISVYCTINSIVMEHPENTNPR